MELKTISEGMNKPIGEKLKDTAEKVFKWDWIFSTPVEKTIVFVCLVWGVISVFRFIYGVVF
jgi:hypothetical protein